MQTRNMLQNDRPVSERNLAFQHRVWIIQQCSLAIMAAFAVAVLLGTVNLGPFSKDSMSTNAELPRDENKFALGNASLYFSSPVGMSEPAINSEQQR